MPPTKLKKENTPFMKQNDDAVTNSDTVACMTCGELFISSGATIDLLRDGQLLLAAADGCSVSTTIHHNQVEYRATPLPATLADTLQLPSKANEHVSTAHLFEQMRDDLRLTTGLSESQSFLVTTFILGTHLLAAVNLPMVNFWGEGSCHAPLTQFASVTCRRPLPLADATFRNLLELPAGLAPTLILPEPKETFLRSLQNSTSLVAYRTLSKQGLGQFRGSVVACTARPLRLPFLPVSLVSETAATFPIAAATLAQLAETYQPQCLSFRAATWQRALQSECDAPQFSLTVRRWARSLGAVLEGEPELQKHLFEVLADFDLQQREAMAQGVAGLVLDILLDAVRRRRPSLYVHELADTVNLALEARHETGRLTPKAIGLVLREELGFETKRGRHGYRLLLNAPTIARISDLAGKFSVGAECSEQHNCEADPSVEGMVAGDAS